MNEMFYSGPDFLNTMTLTGQGQVSTTPDLAVIRLGVQTSGSDLEEIQSSNAQISQSVIQTLNEMGINDIKTFQYTINKSYEQENGKTVERGYTVRNLLEIRTTEMENIGQIIDAAVKAGANVVDLISFELSDPSKFYEQALNLAIMNAIEKAKSIEKNLDISLNPIPVKIIENSGMPKPSMAFQRELAATPVVPGTLMVEASITANFNYETIPPPLI